MLKKVYRLNSKLKIERMRKHKVHGENLRKDKKISTVNNIRKPLAIPLRGMILRMVYRENNSKKSNLK